MFEADDPEPLDPKTHGRFYILDKTGDTRITWDRSSAAEVDMARKQFADWKAKGYVAYKVNPDDGSKGEVMNAFDPEAAKVIFAPAMRGG